VTAAASPVDIVASATSPRRRMTMLLLDPGLAMLTPTELLRLISPNNRSPTMSSP